MSNKSFQKKKDREKEVKKKILARRKAIRSANKKERDEENEKRKIQKVTNRLEGRTIRNNNNENDEKILSQLHHNMEILEALQKEQELLQDTSSKANQLSTETVPMAIKKEGGSLSASADVVFIPKITEETKDGM